MRKTHSLLQLSLAMLLVAGLLLHAPAAARAQGTPVTLTFALPGGASNTDTEAYASGIAQPANSAIRVTALEFTYAGVVATNKAITVKQSAAGPTWLTVSHGAGGGTNYSAVAFETNTWYIRKGSTPAVTSTATNACTVILHGIEQ